MRVTSNRLELMLIGTSVLVIAAAWLFTYWNVVEDRDVTRSSTIKIVDSLAVGLEEHLEVTLRDARNAVHAAAVLIENSGGLSAFKSPERLHKELHRELHDVISTARLIAIDGRGRLIASSSEFPLPEFPIARHDALTWHLSHPGESGFYLGVPHKSVVGGKMVIPYSRAIFDTTGGVAGVVVAELSAEYLASLYAALTNKINASVVVFNHDGIILMRVPYIAEVLGRSATSPAAFKKQLEASGNMEFTSQWDGKTRYYSHRVMRRVPVLIAVGVDKDEVIAPAAARTRHRVALVGAATVIFLALVWLLVMDLRRLTRSEEELQLSFSRLQELSRRIAEVQETERRNISRELHDRVGQNLSALNLNLGMMRTQLPGGFPPAMETRLDDAQQLLESTSQQVRDVMADLRPAALDDYGLLAALRNHAAVVATRLGISVAVEGQDPEPRLPLATETALFRIVQEALNNIAKHARAHRIDVNLTATPQIVKLTTVDDGVGFDTVRTPGNAPTYGITTMRERAEAVGARLHIESAPGKGTRVLVEIARTSS